MSGSKPARFEWALRIGIRGVQVLSLLIGACAGALAEPALRVGVLAVGSPTEEGAKWQPLLTHLAKSLAAPVELTASTHQGLNEKLAEGEIDVLISHPGHGIELLESREAIGPIATRLTRWGGKQRLQCHEHVRWCGLFS
ncbi:PhnD/SsuA/transferrin family substrate-binding protein [Inhella gelatinilytica]|uniref:PhnD/SsuA/transferrin family substrate-binding protein n=1 Tax=Inhella gelatinilytica TaxID=2795030 RepID=A0A931NA46_9BURK|nr:PhnD/SsuA/transferrin family substrate-binding protein [Inhella gelatinilytica]